MATQIMGKNDIYEQLIWFIEDWLLIYNETFAAVVEELGDDPDYDPAFDDVDWDEEDEEDEEDESWSDMDEDEDDEDDDSFEDDVSDF